MANWDALFQMRDVVGATNWLHERDELAPFERATFATKTRLLAIARPARVEQVAALLALAAQSRTPIYPISRGRNCGYGSTVPYAPDSVLLDLGQLDRISEYDEELATVRVQAGVTQERLGAELEARGGRLCMDPIATFPDCSLIGNVVERGHGLGPRADRIANAFDFEVVLANGAIVRTGFGGFANARAAGLERWAPGPQLDGMFTQSPFGIVTSVTLALEPRPECTRTLALALEDDLEFARAIESTRPLRLGGTLRSGPRFYNHLRLIQTLSRFPRDAYRGRALSEEREERLRRELGIPRWTGLLSLQGSEEQVDADEACVRRALGPLAARLDGDRASAWGRFVAGAHAAYGGRLPSVSERPRWRRNPARPRLDDDWSRDECGLIWVPVTIPFRGADALAAIRLYREVFAAHGFESDMSVSAIRERTLEVNASIVFDRGEPTEEERAPVCARAVLGRLAEAGFYPHRVGLVTADSLGGRDAAHRELLATLRGALDPAGILAPGRYVE